MVLLGYLNYNRVKRTYLPTMRLNLLGNWVAGYIQSEGGVRDLVNEMQRRTDETVGLSTQNSLFVQYLFLRGPDHRVQERAARWHDAPFGQFQRRPRDDGADERSRDRQIVWIHQPLRDEGRPDQL